MRAFFFCVLPVAVVVSSRVVPRQSGWPPSACHHLVTPRTPLADHLLSPPPAAVRVRPPLNPNDPGFDLIPQRFQRSLVHCHSPTSLSIDSPQGRKLFVFDRVFSPDVEQAGIWEYLEDGVSAFTSGYNVSLLAYGQSGAGKSYTMGTSGPVDQDNLDIMGVIPRAGTALFEALEGPKIPNPNRSSMSQLRAPARYSQAPAAPRGEKTWTLKATYVEIYNEQLRDLLIPEHVPAHERGNVTIREDVKGNIILTGLRQVEIHSVEDLMNALNQGSTLRQTDATAINARSSRSHAVFSLNLVQRKNKLQVAQGAEKRFSVPLEAMTGAESWITTDSKMHFVDLAGSERLKNTGAQGERAKEGISINAGLAALGKVISQLSSRQPGSHVSYRDSKLTRLLQDSLGGNAITYMIACVTPAEFHLSETLNTVQYAQRARAIQSKPRIQAVEEGDKQAIIDRLKAEVAFLREQIRSAERGGGERRTLATGGSERPERHNEREVELQNQLLDSQENYTALNQRHAKLIAEMAKARDNELAEEERLGGVAGDSATERLNRSNSFAMAVEQVVLEYEKTIQSLEQSLSSTRSTLSNTETALLEKETKCAYNETINNQLQARLQKLMDREQSTENYLHDLEAKLDGHTSGEEKNSTIIMELRKEIARVRENEAACEDYISTLEERLAEADQDAELMQREIDRLEQVVERQRSLGKLDSLLYELDHIQQDAAPIESEPVYSNGAGHRRTASRNFGDHSRSQSHVSRHSNIEETIPESGEEDDAEEDDAAETSPDVKTPRSDATPKAHQPELPTPRSEEYTASPAQSRFVADKLEAVTQELVDLRVDHESTVFEFDMLHRKYEEALRALAELQDVVDEAKHPQRPRDSMLSVTSPAMTRPPSFLSDAVSNETKNGTRYSSTRSLSSELSSALESPATVLDSDTETAVPRSESHLSSIDERANGDALASELGRLKTIAAQKETAEREIAERYAELETKHQETLDMVEELKTEVAKAQAAHIESTSTSPRTSTPVIRRKSSQNVMIIDRAHRSFASLRNIAAESFEDQPDTMQNFELNLNAAMHELHARSERIQELEADVASAKKEMETKMAIISGLTRERSSIKAASPMDMAVVSSLREQLTKNEKQMAGLQESHAAREKELQAQVAELQASLRQHVDRTDNQDPDEELLEQREAQAKKIAELETELGSWEQKHKTALQTLQTAEDQMKKTIGELEGQVASFNAQLAEAEESKPMLQQNLEQMQTKHQELVAFLRSEIDEYKSVIHGQTSKITLVEEQHIATKALLDLASKDRDQASKDVAAHKEMLAKLESQLHDHEQTVRVHQDSLHELQARHVEELDEIRAATQQEHDAQLAALKAEHAKQVSALDADLTEAREDLMKVATQVAFALGLDVSVERISERIEDLIADQKALAQEQKKRSELERHVVDLSAINDTVMRDLEAVKVTLAEVLAEGSKEAAAQQAIKDQAVRVKNKVVDLETRNKKNSRLIEELEDQLQNNFDQAQLTNNRLSTLQSERYAQLEEANAAKFRLQSELETIKEEYASLQVCFVVVHLFIVSLTPRRPSTTASSPRGRRGPTPTTAATSARRRRCRRSRRHRPPSPSRRCRRAARAARPRRRRPGRPARTLRHRRSKRTRRRASGSSRSTSRRRSS
jgi:chromosome segregation ATPase